MYLSFISFIQKIYIINDMFMHLNYIYIYIYTCVVDNDLCEHILFSHAYKKKR